MPDAAVEARVFTSPPIHALLTQLGHDDRDLRIPQPSLRTLDDQLLRLDRREPDIELAAHGQRDATVGPHGYVDACSGW